MSIKEWLELRKLIESLGTGAVIFSGFLGLIYALYPNLFSPNISLEMIMIIGSLIGAGIHRLLNEIIKGIGEIPPNPLNEFPKQKKLAIEKLKILEGSKKLGFISSAKAKRLQEKILTELLLPEKNEATPLMLPQTDQQKQVEGKIDQNLEEE